MSTKKNVNIEPNEMTLVRSMVGNGVTIRRSHHRQALKTHRDIADTYMNVKYVTGAQHTHRTGYSARYE